MVDARAYTVTFVSGLSTLWCCLAGRANSSERAGGQTEQQGTGNAENGGGGGEGGRTGRCAAAEC